MRSPLASLLGRSSAQVGPLTRRGLLPSDLWLDQPDAQRQIDSRFNGGRLNEEQAEKLHHWVDRGYLTLTLDLLERVTRDVAESVERLWEEKPASVAYAYHSGLKLFASSCQEKERKPSYRIADMHSESEGALELFLNRQIFDYVELIFDQSAVATQSLYFEYGSQQPLHRDPVHVHTSPPSHLLASWTALEDIGPRCGALTYVPGSHKLPYYQFDKREHRLHVGRDEAQLEAALEFDKQQCARRGLKAALFTCKRAEVLIWHTSLLHGGSQPEDPTLTRRSFVVHYTTLANCKRHRQNVLEHVPGPDGEIEARGRIFGTDRILTRQGCHGFDNPLRGYGGPVSE